MMDTSADGCDTKLHHELESKRQELYTAQRSIETLNANLQHLEYENNELKLAVAEETQKRKDSQSQDQSRNDHMYRQQIADLKQFLEETQTSEREAKETVSKLEEQLKHVLETAASLSTPVVDNDDEVTELQLQIAKLQTEKGCAERRSRERQSSSPELELAEILELELSKKCLGKVAKQLSEIQKKQAELGERVECKLMETSDQHQRLQQEMAAVRQELAEKEEELECMESQFTTQCDISQSLREELQDLRAQMETQSGQVDTGRKGNSLFSEVDDRRVVAERKLVQLEDLLKDSGDRLAKEQKENKRLRHQVLLLRQTSCNKGYEEDVVKNVQRQLEEARKTVIQLTEQLHKVEANARRKQREEVKVCVPTQGPVTDSDKQYINFLQTVISQHKKEIEAAKSDVQQHQLQCLRTDLHLTEAKNEVMTLTHEVNRQKVMNSQLSMAIQELQLKYEPERFEPPSKEKVKISGQDSGASLFSNTKVLQPTENNRELPEDAEGSADVKNTKETQAASLQQKMSNKNKENVTQSHSGNLFDGHNTKSVRMMSQVSTLSSHGEAGTTELKGDGKGEKLKKTGKGTGTGKFRNVTYGTADTNPVDCRQQ